MAKTINRVEKEIDANGQAVGRIATQAVTFLRGKHRPDFAPNADAGDFVIITNASKVKFTGRKLEQKDYYHHTLYPGGLKRTPMKRVVVADPTEVIRKAIYGMLPKNKLRNEMMKRLTIKK